MAQSIVDKPQVACTKPCEEDRTPVDSGEAELAKLEGQIQQLDIVAAANQEGGEVIQALPPAPANLAGSSKAQGKNFTVEVSNKAGYMCHVHVVVEWKGVDATVPFAVFTHPDNSHLFRDIQRVGTRNVVKTSPGYKEVQVEQLGEIKVLWINRTYSTWLNVTEDARDPECLRTNFELLRSDVLGRFSGNWELRPMRDPETGKVMGCRGELHQDVLPKGMPTFMARMPVLGGVLRGISVRAVTRVLEDMNVIMDKVRAGQSAGRSTEAILKELCGPVAEGGHANGAVASFAFNPEDEEESEEEESEEEASGKHVMAAGAAPGTAPDQPQPEGDDEGKAAVLMPEAATATVIAEPVAVVA